MFRSGSRKRTPASTESLKTGLESIFRGCSLAQSRPHPRHLQLHGVTPAGRAWVPPSLGRGWGVGCGRFITESSRVSKRRAPALSLWAAEPREPQGMGTPQL